VGGDAEVARLLGVGTAETVREWVRQAQIDADARPGVTTEEGAELKKLRRENAELRRANVIFSRCRGLRRDQGVCVVDGVFDVPSRVVRS
jgi:transposase-like protein